MKIKALIAAFFFLVQLNAQLDDSKVKGTSGICIFETEADFINDNPTQYQCKTVQLETGEMYVFDPVNLVWVLVGKDIAFVADYIELDAYAGKANVVFVTSELLQGYFNATNSGKLDNGGTVIVANDGRVWERQYDGYANAEWFGAIPNDGLDDQPALAKSFTLGSVQLRDNSTYNLTSNITFANDLFLIGGQNSKIVTSAGDGFLNEGFSLDVRSVEFEANGADKRLLRYQNVLANDEFSLRFEDCKFSGYEVAVYTNQATYDASATITELRLIGCSFSGGENADILIDAGNVTQTHIQKCRFTDGGNEAINITGQGTYYNISNNFFDNYLNTGAGGDADAHFIRVIGKHGVVSNNVFSNLNVDVGVSAVDTEALRCEVDDFHVIGNTFYNAGMAEAVVALKNCKNTVISGNIFRNDDAYNSQAVARGAYTIAILVGGDLQVTDNTFENFNGAILDTSQGQIGDDDVTINFQNNKIIDSQCDQYSGSQLFRITQINADFFCMSNKVVTGVLNKKPVNIFHFSSAENCHVKDNYFIGTGYVFNNTENGKVFFERNHVEGFSRLLDAPDLLVFRGSNNYWYCDVQPNYAQLFGAGTITSSIFDVQNLTIRIASASARYVGFRPDANTIGEYSFVTKFKSTQTAIHTARGYFGSDATGTVTLGFLYYDDLVASATTTKTSPSVNSNLVVFRTPDNAAFETETTVNIKIVK